MDFSKRAGSHRICHTMLVYGIKGETDILVYAAALRAVLIISANHAALYSHHSNPTLVAARQTAVSVQCSARIGLIYTAVWIT